MSIDKEINTLTENALKNIDIIMQKILVSKENMELYSIGTIGRAKALLREFQEPIFDRNPKLKPSLPEDYNRYRTMSKEEQSFCEYLSDEKLKEIDEALLSHITNRFSKVAMIIGTIIKNNNIHIKGIPDIFYLERICLLVDEGLLEAKGNLNNMRFSEVRLANNSI